MRVWTTGSFRAFDLLAGPEPVDGVGLCEVGGILARAAEVGARVTLTRREGVSRRLPVEALAIRMEGEHLIVGQPRYLPGQRALAAGEHLDIRIALAEGSYLGETTVVVRLAPDTLPAKAATYGLARPRMLLLDDRRGNERIGVAADEQTRVELLCMPRHSLLASGPIVDLSVGGLRLRGAETLRVRAGDRVLVRGRLNAECRIHAAGIVVHAGQRDDGTADIGVRFQTEQMEVDRFIRHLAAPVAGQGTRTG